MSSRRRPATTPTAGTTASLSLVSLGWHVRRRPSARAAKELGHEELLSGLLNAELVEQPVRGVGEDGAVRSTEDVESKLHRSLD